MDGTSKVSALTPATQPPKEKIFGWFEKILPASFFQSLKRDLEIVGNSCVFTLSVTTWLMMMQRLSGKGTLAAAVSELTQGNGRELLEPCKQVLEGRISAGTGAFSQARERIPVEASRRVAERTFEQLHEIAPCEGLRNRLFLLDGSSIRLAHAPAVIKAYPQAENQHGKSHWPVARIAVMHHVVTGLAMPPKFGPMYGSAAVSEQLLAEALIDGLPSSAVMIADRNFGVFAVAWRAQRQGHHVLVRLTAARAERLGRADWNRQGDHKLVWQPSREDRRAHPDLPADASLEGRLIVAQLEHSKEPLYLFTTLGEPAAEVIVLYKERWLIETDLRSLKEQVRLHAIPARSPDLIARELYLAIASYNLIRAVMNEAARAVGVEPRRLSFSRSQDAFWAFARATAHTSASEQEFDSHWRILLRSIGQCKLPNRKRKSVPRAVWRRRQGFPYRDREPNGEV